MNNYQNKDLTVKSIRPASAVKRAFGAGFTLTEVLIAVMIVGLIGVALASLTTAASRESGVGRSKVMLRNNLSLALRQIRQDISQASRIDYRSENTVFGTTAVPILKIAKNVDSEGKLVQQQVLNAAGTEIDGTTLPAQWITYCFTSGTITTDVVPVGAKRGGRITRHVKENNTGAAAYPDCTEAGELVLSNVKLIPKDANNYPVPWVGKAWVKNGGSDIQINANDLGSLMMIKIITELNSTPPVNDVVEEVFAVPNGF